MSKITVAQLAEQMAALTSVVSALVEQQSETVVETPKATSKAGELAALRAANGDSFAKFEDVFKAQLRKAKSQVAEKGPMALWYVWSANKNRSYVMPAKAATKYRNGTLLATVTASGVKPAVKGLPLGA